MERRDSIRILQHTEGQVLPSGEEMTVSAQEQNSSGFLICIAHIKRDIMKNLTLYVFFGRLVSLCGLELFMSFCNVFFE